MPTLPFANKGYSLFKEPLMNANLSTRVDAQNVGYCGDGEAPQGPWLTLGVHVGLRDDCLHGNRRAVAAVVIVLTTNRRSREDPE